MLTSWRLVALALAVAALLIGPFLMVRSANRASADATAWVSHTYEVDARARELLAEVRNAEAAALAMALRVQAPRLQQRLSRSLPAAATALERLQTLLSDNPAQLVRLGRLRENIDGRLNAIRRLPQLEETAQVHATVHEMVERYPIDPLALELIAAEQTLLRQREQRADQLRQRADALGWGALLAQLLMLTGLLVWTARGITHRIAMEARASRLQTRAALILDTVREPIAVLDRKLRVVLRNAAFDELYAVPADSTEPSLPEVGNGAWQNEEALRRLADVGNRNRELWDFSLDQRSADGVTRSMLLNAVRMALPDSDDITVLLTASDVSAQKAAQREILDLNRQLEGKVEQISDVNRELEAFSYSVSHDLRAPLRHVAGFADKLRRHLGDARDEKTTRYLDIIGDSAKRMSQLIDDLLVYSRLGRSAMRMQSVDMQSLVAEKRPMLDANAEADNPAHRIQWKIAPLPIVIGDENMLRQVWLNLLGNAVKYSMRSEPAQIEVGYRRLDDGAHRFSVHDNGVGFDMAYAGKLFGVFQRLHGAGEFEGTGIGLASVRRVIMRHGGQIGFDAVPGQGATFWFTLPPISDASQTSPTA